MIDQTTTTDAATPTVSPNSVMYRTLPFHISMAAVRAQTNGLVRADEFPPATDDWIADGITMRAFLKERGAWEAYRSELAAGAFVTNCPGWCGTRHAALGDGESDGTILHELPVASVTLSTDVDVTVSIEGYQDVDDVEPPAPRLLLRSAPGSLDDLDLTAADAALVAELLTTAARTMGNVERLLAGGAQ